MTDSASISPPIFGSVPRAWLLTLAVGLAAGLITWAAGESLMVSETGTGSRGGRPISPVVFSTRNGMTSFGILGASLGLGLGLVGGLLRGSPRSAAVAGLVGLALGGGAGYGSARMLVPAYFKYYQGTDLTVPLAVHAGIWTAIGIAAGLAFGLGMGGPRRAFETLAHAVPGALLATVTYEFAGIMLFPLAQTDRPLPMSSGSRLFAHMVVSLVIGTALILGVSRGRALKASPASVPA